MMKILKNLEKYNKDKFVLKEENLDKKEKEDQEKEKKKKKTIVGNNFKDQLSIIKEDSFGEKMESNNQKNELEISKVGSDKLIKKKKNVSEIQNLIEECYEEIINLNTIIEKYKKSTGDLIMQSAIIDDRSMVFINKKDEQEIVDDDDNEKKSEYFKEIHNKICGLKKKLENLLSLYQLEEKLTEIKKKDLENFESLKDEYKKLKENIKKNNSKI